MGLVGPFGSAQGRGAGGARGARGAWASCRDLARKGGKDPAEAACKHQRGAGAGGADGAADVAAGAAGAGGAGGAGGAATDGQEAARHGAAAMAWRGHGQALGRGGHGPPQIMQNLKKVNSHNLLQTLFFIPETFFSPSKSRPAGIH